LPCAGNESNSVCADGHAVPVDGTTPEVCTECGFDSRVWRARDAASLLDALGWWWRLALEDVPHDVLNARPASDVWSVLEYGDHTAAVTAVLRVGIGLIVEQNDVDLGGPFPPPALGDARVLDALRVIDDIEREGTALAALARKTPEAALRHTGRLGRETIEAGAALLHAAHDASHHQMDVGRLLAPHVAPATGAVVQINASDGGVPKQPIPLATIDHGGVVGDRQRDRKHHGRPFQALCLWSTEVLDALVAEGHPIGPGSAGENLTVSGIDWAALRPGTRLRIGTAVAEISFPATPCAHQTRWFSDGDFGRIDHDRNPHLTRWYAWVREPGEVHPGDPVTSF
jgi:MOSC domain-containing protein YiiM